MKTIYSKLFSNSGILLLLVSSFLSNTTQSSFAPVDWNPEVLPAEQCGLASVSGLSDALATVAQLMKGNDIASSLPKSCMEIKESSPVSPSGYYTISNGSEGSVVVYCNMEELYSCPSLEQTLKGFSSTLLGFTNTVTGVSGTVTEVASTVTGMSSTLTGVSNDVTGMSITLTGVTNDVTEMSSTLTGVSSDVTEMSSTLTAVSNDVTGMSNTLTGVANGVTGMSNTLTGVTNNVSEMSSTLSGVSIHVTGMSNTLTGVSNNVTGMSGALTGVSNNVNKILDDLDGVSDILESNSACGSVSTSCQQVWNKCPECTSGHYKILAADLTEQYVYCSFEEKCGTAGPWTRVAYLNMSDSSSVCPSGTQKFVSGSAFGCGIQEPSDPKCLSITHSITHSYSEICGEMVGYQKGSPDAFYSGQNGINGNYVDGVSITRGSPRQHVWTYAIGLQENLYYSSGYHICPCGATSKQQVPSFVGNDYYCESGCPGNFDHVTIYADDVLWDGEQCGSLETDCCTNTDQPWFHKVLDTTTSDDLEMRLCINQHTNDENLVVSLYDIYVK